MTSDTVLPPMEPVQMYHPWVSAHCNIHPRLTEEAPVLPDLQNYMPHCSI